MEKIKVLHFTIANTGGGITRFILNLWGNIDRTQFQFDFVTMSQYLDYAEELERDGCKIYYVSTYAEDDKEQFKREIGAILDNGYDVVHLHTSWWRGFALEEIAKEKGVPKVIIHSHSSDVHIKEGQSREDARRLHEEQKKLLTEEMATDFLSCSWKAADWLYGKQIPKDKVKIIPNAIDLNLFRYDENVRCEYRNRLGIRDQFVIGHVGRFAYIKNHEFLIDVFREVAKYRNNVVLLLIGVGELEEEIRKKVQNANLAEKVIFAGKRNDVNCLMQAMDLFVLPSRSEGLGIVLIEAQTAGLRCLVSDGVPEEAQVTEDFKCLKLEKETWKREIINCIDAEDNKKDNYDKVLDAGYAIEKQVNILERIYRE